MTTRNEELISGTAEKKTSGKKLTFGDRRTSKAYGSHAFTSFFIESLANSVERQPRHRLYGSTASFCPRLNFFLAQDMGVSSNHTAASSLYMGIGDGIEKSIVSSLSAKGRLISTNFFIPKIEPEIGGKVDIMYIDPEDELSIGEIKSCGSLPTKPKDRHLSQLMTYIAVTGAPKSQIIYVSRNVVDSSNDVQLRVFEVKPTASELLATFERIVMSGMSIEKNLVPPVPEGFTANNECFYCDFKRFCHDGLLSSYKNMSITDEQALMPIVKEKAQELFEGRSSRWKNLLIELNDDLEKNSQESIFLTTELSYFDASNR